MTDQGGVTGRHLIRLKGRDIVQYCVMIRIGGKEVPWKSRFGNWISSVVFRALSGIYLADTQTGFRAFDGSLLELMLRVPGERFEYETSVLLACAKQDIPVRTEKIETVYEEKNAGTHFRPVKDSIRVMAALFHEPAKFILSSLFCAASVCIGKFYDQQELGVPI